MMVRPLRARRGRAGRSPARSRGAIRAPSFRRTLTSALAAAAGTVGMAVVLGAAPASAAKTPAPTITSFTATPTSLSTAGGPVTLSATVTGATSCTLTSSPAISGLSSHPACATGKVSVPVTVPVNTTTKALTYKFTLTATGSRSVKRTTNVTVAGPKPTITTFAATPKGLGTAGGSVKLSATVSNASSCTFSSTPAASGLPSTALPCSTGTATDTVTLPGASETSPVTYTFTLTAKAAKGGQAATSTVQVTVGLPTLARIALVPVPATTDTIRAGGTEHYVVDGYDALTRLLGQYTSGFRLSIAPSTTASGTPTGAQCTSAALTCTATRATDGGDPSSYTVTAEGYTLTATTDLYVNPGPVTSITLDPTTPTVPAGEDQIFTVTGTDRYGNVATVTVATHVGLSITPTTATPSLTGTCQAGPGTTFTCRSLDAATFTVTATDRFDTGVRPVSATMTVTPGTPATLTLTPQTTTVIAGTPVTYHVSGFDKYHNRIPVVTGVSLDINDGSTPGCTDTASTCTPDAVGTWTVTAAVTEGTPLSTVVVSGTARVTANPNGISISSGTDPALDETTVKAGVDQPFIVTAYDVNKKNIGAITQGVVLALTPPDAGSCDSTAQTCTFEKPGTVTVTAAYGATSASEQITVVPASLEVTPATATITPGGTVSYHVYELDANTQRLGPATGATLTVTGGSCTGSGATGWTCTARTPGDHRVAATLGTALGSGVLTVLAPAPVIGPATLPPARVGQLYTQQMTVTGITGPLVWDLGVFQAGDAIPPGISITSTGKLHGTPTAPGTYTFNIGVNKAGATPFADPEDFATETVTLTVVGGLTVSGSITVNYFYTVLTYCDGEASCETAAFETWSVTYTVSALAVKQATGSGGATYSVTGSADGNYQFSWHAHGSRPYCSATTGPCSYTTAASGAGTGQGAVKASWGAGAGFATVLPGFPIYPSFTGTFAATRLGETVQVGTGSCSSSELVSTTNLVGSCTLVTTTRTYPFLVGSEHYTITWNLTVSGSNET